MTDNRSDKALALLAQLSYIDEEHIAYADSYFVKKPSKKPLYAAICTAAAVFIIMTLALNTFLAEFESPSDMIIETGIAAVLRDADADTSDSPDLFTPCIMWQTEGFESYRVVQLTEDEIKSLSADISSGTTVESYDNTELKMWLCPGNGTVISPYLIQSDGNTGISLFDYKAELIPSESFTEKLENIVNERN